MTISQSICPVASLRVISLTERIVCAMRFMPRLWLCLLTAISFPLILHSPGMAGAASPEFKTYMMDSENKIIRSVSLPSGTVEEFPKLERSPSLMVLSPNGSRLMAFEYADKGGTADDRIKGSRIYRFGKPNSLSIFDTSQRKLVAKIEDVGWNAVAQPVLVSQAAEISAAWDSSGQLLTLLAWGKKDKNPEIVQIDISKAAVVGRRPLACAIGEVDPLLQISADTAAVLYGKRSLEGKTAAGYKLLLVNLKNLAESKEVSLPGIPRDLAGSSDGEHVFALSDDGTKIDQPGQSHLHVISVQQGSLLNRIDGGFALVDSLTDSATGLTWIARIGKTGQSTLFAFQQDKIKAEIEIPDVIVQLNRAPKTHRLCVLCYDSVQVIDLETQKLAGSIRTPHRKRGVWEKGNRNRPPSSLAFDSVESVGVLEFSGDDEMSVLDLKNFQVKGTIDLISGTKAFASAMMIAAATGALAGAGSAVAGVPVTPVFIPSAPSAKYSSCIVDLSDQYVFIARMAHVSIADLKTFKKVEDISLGFNARYAFLSNPAQGHKPLLFVAGSRMGFTSKVSFRMDVVDMATKAKLPDQEWRGHCLYTHDGKYAVNFDSENLYLLDASNLSILKTVGGFKDLLQIMLAP